MRERVTGGLQDATDVGVVPLIVTIDVEHADPGAAGARDQHPCGHRRRRKAELVLDRGERASDPGRHVVRAQHAAERVGQCLVRRQPREQRHVARIRTQLTGHQRAFGGVALRRARERPVGLDRQHRRFGVGGAGARRDVDRTDAVRQAQRDAIPRAVGARGVDRVAATPVDDVATGVPAEHVQRRRRRRDLARRATGARNDHDARRTARRVECEELAAR